MDSLSSGIGSKSKPCTKFFSTAGCPFGESCHFLHYVHGGYNAVAQMMNLVPIPTRTTGPPPISNGTASTAVKTKICNKFNTAEGCKFGDKCHFAHGEWELGKPIAASQEDPRAVGPIPGRIGGRMDPPIPAGSFGASATAKISVDASLASAIIGRGGVNSKQICRQTGAKLAIRDHETDPNLRNIELEGTFEQIKEASAMVRDLISSIGFAGGPAKPTGGSAKPVGGPAPRSNYKTKICENFSNGSCTFGDRCHFAHGEAELRQHGA
ncbi:zinc finger CCCH domain-containing 14-like [Olea europaea subsp. europaea]|nr:zinc finger CCCH domain-containing 14-like [Olea europaea subsp. europaea]